jgi:hypothetical protein
MLSLPWTVSADPVLGLYPQPLSVLLAARAAALRAAPAFSV